MCVSMQCVIDLINYYLSICLSIYQCWYKAVYWHFLSALDQYMIPTTALARAGDTWQPHLVKCSWHLLTYISIGRKQFVANQISSPHGTVFHACLTKCKFAVVQCSLSFAQSSFTWKSRYRLNMACSIYLDAIYSRTECARYADRWMFLHETQEPQWWRWTTCRQSVKRHHWVRFICIIILRPSARWQQ